MPATVCLGREVSAVDRRHVQPGGDASAHPDAAGLELGRLVGVVREQVQPLDAETQQHLYGDAVVPLVRSEAQGEVGLVGVQPVLLQRVGVELAVQADATALLPQVEQVATDLADPRDRLLQLRTAVAAFAAEGVPGEALAVQPHQRDVSCMPGAVSHSVAEGEGHVLAAVAEPVEAEQPRRGERAVGQTDGEPHLSADGGRGDSWQHGFSSQAVRS
jgi:hypothetical protein